MNTTSNQEYQNALDTILEKAAGDAAFRRRALEDAPAAIKEATGLEAPEGTSVRFVEFDQPYASDGKNYVIPLPPATSDELTDSDLLDGVAGGTTGRSSGYRPYEKDNSNAV